MSYRQLTEGQRYQISLLLSEKFSLREIATKLGVAPSTISREVRRNSVTPGCYEPCNAHKKTNKRRSESHKRGICKSTIIAVEMLLEWNWSPEQISAVCKRIGQPVSHEWVYSHIIRDFKRGGQLHQYLRHRLKRYRKRTHKQRGRIVDRRSIHDCSISRGCGADNLACFRHVALNQIRREKTIDASVNRKQKMATMSEDVLDLIVNA